MKIAHLILAHKAPRQLERLVRALAHPEADVFIHLDRKADVRPFAALQQLPHVAFTRRRFDVRWGGYSLTNVVIESLREILQEPVAYECINLLSGEDYPIKSRAVIHAFFAQHRGRSFVECEPEGSAWWAANRSHVSEYHLTEYRFPGRYFVQHWLNRLLPPRTAPLLPVLYGGNMGGWYALSRESATYLVGYLDAHPRLRRFFQLTWGSDEVLIHSILLNSPLAATVVNNNLRYIDWSGGGHSPKVLTRHDLPRLVASSRLYARKFDLAVDAAVLDELDQLNA